MHLIHSESPLLKAYIKRTHGDFIYIEEIDEVNEYPPRLVKSTLGLTQSIPILLLSKSPKGSIKLPEWEGYLYIQGPKVKGSKQLDIAPESFLDPLKEYNGIVFQNGVRRLLERHYGPDPGLMELELEYLAECCLEGGGIPLTEAQVRDYLGIPTDAVGRVERYLPVMGTDSGLRRLHGLGQSELWSLIMGPGLGAHLLKVQPQSLISLWECQGRVEEGYNLRGEAYRLNEALRK